jgi:hypothetical protein
MQRKGRARYITSHTQTREQQQHQFLENDPHARRTPVGLSQEIRQSTIIADSTARLSDNAYGVQDEHNGEDEEDGHNEQHEQDGLDGQQPESADSIPLLHI